MADFFTLPDSGEIWRKKGGDKIYLMENEKRVAAYECESLYDSEKKVVLKGSDRVDLVDR
jgi:hypothetical protein